MRNAFKAGDKIANEFRVVRRLGEGAFGAVYLCHSSQGECAVKVLQRIDDARARQMLIEEARRWVGLGAHPNVIVAAGVREHARIPCIVMEFIDGAPYSELIGRDPDWRLALWVGAQAAAGLAHAWKTSQLLHRDIKPSNIIVRAPDYTAKVSDFGLATATRFEVDKLGGARIGTPFYMAPELWRGEPAEIGADIYAFGVTMYEGVTGQWPYAHEAPGSVDDVATCHLNGRPTDLRALNGAAPADLAELVMSCLDKTIERRPPSFEQLADRLRKLARDLIGSDPKRVSPPRRITSADRLVNLVGVCQANGDMRGAREYAKQAIRADAGSAKAWAALASVEGKEHRLHEAAKLLTKAARLSPDPETTFTILRDLASVHDRLGEQNQARDWLDQAMALAKRRSRVAMLDASSDLIVSLLPYNDALYWCDQILAADPKAAITWNNRAILCRRNGVFAEAERSARQALELNPLYAKAWANLANALNETGRHLEAIGAAQQAIAAAQKTAGAYLALHRAHIMLGDYAAASRALDEGARLMPEDPLIRKAKALPKP